MKPGSFAVGFTSEARSDLRRLLDFLIESARHPDDLLRALDTIDALEAEIQQRLASTPYLYRHAEGNTLLRELVVPTPSRGYLALYEITNVAQVIVIAVRHQLEDDYL